MRADNMGCKVVEGYVCRYSSNMRLRVGAHSVVGQLHRQARISKMTIFRVNLVRKATVEVEAAHTISMDVRGPSIAEIFWMGSCRVSDVGARFVGGSQTRVARSDPMTSCEALE